jgi:hypothetical protein
MVLNPYFCSDTLVTLSKDPATHHIDGAPEKYIMLIVTLLPKLFLSFLVFHSVQQMIAVNPGLALSRSLPNPRPLAAHRGTYCSYPDTV